MKNNLCRRLQAVFWAESYTSEEGCGQEETVSISSHIPSPKGYILNITICHIPSLSGVLCINILWYILYHYIIQYKLSYNTPYDIAQFCIYHQIQCTYSITSLLCRRWPWWKRISHCHGQMTSPNQIANCPRQYTCMNTCVLSSS